MKTMGPGRARNIHLVILGVLLALTVAVRATTEDWQRQGVDWRAGGGRIIKGIYVPKDKPFPTAAGQPSPSQTAVVQSQSTSAAIGAAAASAGAGQVDSPPVAGFTINIAVAVTNARSADSSDWVAQPRSSIVGSFPTDHPETDFAIGLFDTGASFHLLGYAAAEQTGILAANLLTSNTIRLQGSTGSASAWLSQPLAIFIDGLAAVDRNTMILNLSAPDFRVDIAGITNSTAVIPGFFIDTVEIPAVGSVLSYAHVPVVVLDSIGVDGYYLDGIIGTNLLVDFDFVLRGGGLSGQDSPSLAFQRITSASAGDIVGP